MRGREVGVPVEKEEQVPMRREVGVVRPEHKYAEQLRHIPTTNPSRLGTPAQTVPARSLAATDRRAGSRGSRGAAPTGHS